MVKTHTNSMHSTFIVASRVVCTEVDDPRLNFTECPIYCTVALAFYSQKLPPHGTTEYYINLYNTV